MVSIDFRTRYQGEAPSVAVEDFLSERVPRLLDANGEEAGRSATRLGLPPLTLEVSGHRLTLSASEGRLSVRAGTAQSLVVQLDHVAFSDLVDDVASTFGLQMTGRAKIHQGEADEFVAWEPVLRTFLDGRPVYEPGQIRFFERTEGPWDLAQTFGTDSDPGEMGRFLAETGYLHIAGVFTAEEMAEVSADLDRAVDAATPDDGASWWARTSSGEHYPARILGFNHHSAALRELVRTERFTRIGTLTGDQFVQRDPDDGDSAEGLLKKVGVVEGISDVSWHKDCSMGGHSRGCCGLTVGISVTGARRENGELGVVVGSHRANIAPLGVEGLDLPRLPLPTSTGDVTVHCSCTVHMSRPPVSAERRVVYTGFNLAPRGADRPSRPDAAEIRRQRAALNDHVRTQQHDQVLGGRTASFELQ